MLAVTISIVGIGRQTMSDHRFIAAMDHSGGSTGGVLERYKQEYEEEDKMDKVHEMRLRMLNCPDFNSDNIWAAILYQDTVKRGMVSILKTKNIAAFLKVDSGLMPDGTLKQFPVKQMIELAKFHDCYGTKMRSVVKSRAMIDKVLDQQFTIAKTISDAGLMPIIEPEVPIDHVNKEMVESQLKWELYEHLDLCSHKVILKLTPPEKSNLYHDLTKHRNVEKIVFLSGGYETLEACNRLSLNHDVTASFSRALTEGLFHHQTIFEFNHKLGDNIKNITEAS
jgi:fructose-bisphosphate aldolase, class I